MIRFNRLELIDSMADALVLGLRPRMSQRCIRKKL